MRYKTLPNSELELMMILWKMNRAMTRTEIEELLPQKNHWSKTTVLSFLERLEEKGFVRVEKEGRSNCYIPLVKEEDYLKQESGSILKRLYGSSVKKFVAALYDGDGLSKEQIDELKDYLDQL
ncbi:MAG: BlaI/MecI/CopY family transcriptional regulator [Muribaculaceae bacterium]|nr:BlaI/MecI/CopY family transcriptional regulator [Roseburia sp.]MCM1430145.1 BlaI/MecI/CopY family transcriptional regulator [Muribaculaceae bacterium]MCM1493076.1 BlaI/MecI/CopY family transcriptional regulator [Muribaculaceae bacterium]